MPGPDHDHEGAEVAAHASAPVHTEEVGPSAAQAATAVQAGQLDASGATALQQSAGNTAVSRLVAGGASSPGDLVRDVLSSPGRSLDSGTSSMLSSAVGADVSGMRVHSGPAAAASARAVDAEMFLSGQHLVAPAGLDVHTDEGLFKTVHEAAHFVQQSRGPVAGTATGDGLSISDPSDTFEQHADRVAADAVAARHQA